MVLVQLTPPWLPVLKSPSSCEQECGWLSWSHGTFLSTITFCGVIWNFMMRSVCVFLLILAGIQRSYYQKMNMISSKKCSCIMCLKCSFLLFSVLFFLTLYNPKKRTFSCGGTKEMMPNEVVRVASRGTTCFRSALEQPLFSALSSFSIL